MEVIFTYGDYTITIGKGHKSKRPCYDVTNTQHNVLEKQFSSKYVALNYVIIARYNEFKQYLEAEEFERRMQEEGSKEKMFLPPGEEILLN